MSHITFKSPLIRALRYAVLLPVANIAHAEDAPPADKPPAPEVKTEAETKSSLEDDITGWGFSPGLAVIHSFGKQAIEAASVDTAGNLRVERASKVRAGAILESHFLFGDPRYNAGDLLRKYEQSTAKSSDKPRPVTGAGDDQPATISSSTFSFYNKAYGPTFAVEFGDNVIRSAGVGFMISFRRFDAKASGFNDKTGRYDTLTITPRGKAFNLALLAMVEPDVRSLGDGLVAGQPLPTGATIQFEKSHRLGVGLMFSTTF